MRYSQSSCAKKYAQAYVRVFHGDMNISVVQNIERAISFFRQHSTFISLVAVLQRHTKHQNKLLIELIEHFSLPNSLHQLANLLIDHNTLPLLPAILKDIACLYLQQENILPITIYSTTPLQEIEQKQFEDFFAKLSRKKIISQSSINQALIAGVRIQSDIFLWEYSIAKRIQELSGQMLLKV